MPHYTDYLPMLYKGCSIKNNEKLKKNRQIIWWTKILDILESRLETITWAFEITCSCMSCSVKSWYFGNSS